MSFTLMCCRRRCFRRFEFELIAVDKVLVPPHNLHVTLMFLMSSFLLTILKYSFDIKSMKKIYKNYLIGFLNFKSLVITSN